MGETPGLLPTRRALLLGAAALLAGCARTPPGNPGPAPSGAPGSPVPPAVPAPGSSGTPAPGGSASPGSGATDVAAQMARTGVPVLCYHQIRPWAAGDSAYNKRSLICPPENFRRQLDGLVEAGYTSITPDAYLAHVRTGAPLPAKPVLLTFDDGKDSQPLVAAPELTRRGLTGVFFVMTVVIGNAGWIAPAQIRAMADAGHIIGSHTWDHHDVRKYTDNDFETQFVKARETLRKHSGQAVETFAYPYGAWNVAALPKLADAGFTTAFQLQEQKVDAAAPTLTLRRTLVDSTWDGAAIVKAVAKGS